MICEWVDYVPNVHEELPCGRHATRVLGIFDENGRGEQLICCERHAADARELAQRNERDVAVDEKLEELAPRCDFEHSFRDFDGTNASARCSELATIMLVIDDEQCAAEQHVQLCDEHADDVRADVNRSQHERIMDDPAIEDAHVQCELWWPSSVSGGLDDAQCVRTATLVVDQRLVCAVCAHELRELS